MIQAHGNFKLHHNSWDGLGAVAVGLSTALSHPLTVHNKVTEKGRNENHRTL